MTLGPCLTCHRPTHGSRCADCQRQYQRQLDVTRPAADQLYSSARWQRMRRRVLDEEAWTCHYCGRLATLVDHRIPLRVAPHLGLERSNLVAACRSCNQQRAGRGATRSRAVALSATPRPSTAGQLSPRRFGPGDE